MVYDLSPGDVIHVGDSVTLRVLAVNGDQIRLALESLDGECLHVENQRADQGWWELN
jgi:hypothetical protein